MTEVPDITFSSGVVVRVAKHNLSDRDVCTYARTSTTGEELPDRIASEPRDERLIHALMRERHGSPFEHGSITFFCDVPGIVVWQMVRHRAGVSFSVESGRYRELPAEFYLPDSHRPVVQVGKAMDYDLVAGTFEQETLVVTELEAACVEASARYQRLLAGGVCREVARFALPTWLQYWNLYVTFNARSLMHFLSLRVRDARATYDSKPQWEIQMVAEAMELEFARVMPVTHEAFNDYGRVAP